MPSILFVGDLQIVLWQARKNQGGKGGGAEAPLLKKIGGLCPPTIQVQ